MNTWITRSTKGVNSPRYRLFCFPFAGGSAATFRDWPQGLMSEVEICSINLPGRGARFEDAAIDNMDQLTDALIEALKGEMDRPFFFFGHSMGAMVAFELARKLRQLGCRIPEHLFLSGRPAPKRVPASHMPEPVPDEGLIAMLAALNGTQQGVLENAELLEFMLPPLRADMTLVQTHSYAPQAPLSSSLTIFSGESDPTLTDDDLKRWRYQTSAAFRLHILPGDHFFLNTSREALLSIIDQKLRTYRDNDSE
ncbi:putative thioesterase [Shewanella sp. WE21]|uniref:thioesterase II family protein n=1 Tax=Shewanella sp. WE21 TaxID=2029986 RepID=UPI000CF6A268|nr:alpha/beta fold hydrolase [Shewanella sp. WE21]AVI65895.1 putative thioesterase [Shewanella sp. WE21]